MKVRILILLFFCQIDERISKQIGLIQTEKGLTPTVIASLKDMIDYGFFCTKSREQTEIVE